MGYGVLRIDLETLKQALRLPEDCKIVAVRQFYDAGTQLQADLAIQSDTLPDVRYVDQIPMLSAHCTFERCKHNEEHTEEDGFRCEKITTRLEVTGQGTHAFAPSEETLQVTKVK